MSPPVLEACSYGGVTSYEVTRSIPTVAPRQVAKPTDWSRSRHEAHHNVGSGRLANPSRTP